MDLKLNDKRVLVTGSTGGIGKKIAEVYLAEGATVYINGRDLARCEKTAQELSAGLKGTGKALCAPADLSDASQSEQLIEKLLAEGGLDILINNTGVFEVKPFTEITDEEWLHYFNVNVLSAVRLARGLLPHMLEKNFGRIVNVSSECAIKPLANMVHYSVTKTALLSLSRALAELTKGKNVTVNSVLPGPTWTGGVENYFETLSQSENKPVATITADYFKEHEPTSLLQRFVDVEEVAQATVYLTSNPAMNGQGLRVEGGIIRAL